MGNKGKTVKERRDELVRLSQTSPCKFMFGALLDQLLADVAATVQDDRTTKSPKSYTVWRSSEMGAQYTTRVCDMVAVSAGHAIYLACRIYAQDADSCTLSWHTTDEGAARKLSTWRLKQRNKELKQKAKDAE